MFTNEICPKLCPGCKHRELSVEESINRKTCFLQTKFNAWAAQLQPIHYLMGAASLNYRTKVCLHTAYVNKKWRFGLISKKELIPIENCPVHGNLIKNCIQIFSRILPPGDVFPIRFYVQSGKQIMLVVKAKAIPEPLWLSDNIKNELQLQGVEGVWVHTNPSAGHKVFMKNGFTLLMGSAYSSDDTGMIYGPMSFTQQIPELYLKSLRDASEFLNPEKDSMVIDLYSGIGYSSTLWQKAGAKVIAVELNGEAVCCFKKNVPQIEILRGKCADRIPQLNDFIKKNNTCNRLLYVNPPRTGVEKNVINWITEEYKPSKIAYLSCSPGTLVRDIGILENNNYKIQEISPFDFFPYTHHVECLALLVRK